MRLNRFIGAAKESFLGSSRYAFNPASLVDDSYPLDLEFTLRHERSYYAPKDATGVPATTDEQGAVVSFPTRVSTYALAHFNRYVERKDGASRALFLRMADWFKAAEDGVWLYHCDYHFMDTTLRGPFCSAMAQGKGISVLVRAYKLTAEEVYLVRARQAMTPLLVPLAAGGLRSRIGGHWEFLEEYPLQAPRHTLNGFLAALIGLHDLASLAPEAAEQVGLGRLISSLKHNLGHWDMGYWSAYDAHRTQLGLRNPATVIYHRIHSAQLHYLGSKLGEPVLIETAERWFAQQREIRKRLRALGAKLAYRAVEKPTSFRATTPASGA